MLIVRRTGCRKTYFTQKRAIKYFFGQLRKVKLVSSIKLKAQREAEIESCFSCGVEFLNSKGFKKFNDLLDDFKARSNTAKVSKTYSLSEEDIVNSGFSEKSKLD